MTIRGQQLTTLTPVDITIATYAGVQATCVHGLADLFMYADHFARRHTAALPPSVPGPPGDGDEPLLRVTHWNDATSRDDGEAEGHAHGGRGAPAVVIVPASQLGPAQPGQSPQAVAWAKRCHRQGAIVAAVCGGVFLLAETGLLDGRRTTTHWMFADELQRRFPRLRVTSDRLVIDDGDLITAGGVLAWADLGLTIVQRFLGRTVMCSTARFMMMDPPGREQRLYGQFTPRMQHGDRNILAVQHWLHADPCVATTVEDLAGRAALGPRTFLRRFVRATGMKPSEYRQRLRVAHGREMLEFGTQSVEQIAVAAGFEDPGAFRRSFKKFVGLTPKEYRLRFNRPLNAASDARSSANEA